MSRQFWAVAIGSIAAFVGVSLYGQSLASPPQVEEHLLTPKRLPVPPRSETATFAGGCFWGVEETLRQVPGVVDTRAGYTGGTLQHPTYETMHREKTGHVEAVEVTFDPAKVPYRQLVTIFFKNHDGTRPGKADQAMGKQYRSFIFTHNESQAKAAAETMARLAATKEYKGAPRALATQIRPAQTFWPAEEYHQRYYEKRGGGNVCAL